MKRQQLLTEARDLLTLFVNRVRGSGVLSLTDLNKIAEGFVLELFRELFNLPGLRDLNEEEPNFPGLDLGDDTTHLAFQVTASTDIEKVKSTLQTVLDAGLDARFPHVRIYVLTEKRATRAQKTIERLTQGRLKFDVVADILDFRDLLKICGTMELERLERVVGILKKHLSESAAGAAPEFSSGVPEGREPVFLNLLPITFPETLYFADYIPPAANAALPSRGARRSRRWRPRQRSPRHEVVQDILRRGFDAPEDFEIHGGQLLSLHDPAAPGSALMPYFDSGTLTTVPPAAFYRTDEDQLRVFKSLLRRALQRQLRSEYILWQHEARPFIYAPVRGFEERRVVWSEERTSERTVFEATMKKDKPGEALTCKHLAFYVDFHLIETRWYLALVPSWFFSRDGYTTDGFGGKRISWLKRQEHDQQVFTHFRFICHHLRMLQERSLFDGPHPRTFIRIGDEVPFRNHPYLPDHLWKPASASGTRDDAQLSLVP